MDFMKSERAKESFGPLVFEENRCDLLQNVDTRCLLCEDEFNLQISLPMFLAHIFDVHNIVIEDVQNIANLHDYISYWQQKFKNTPIEQIIPSITFDSTNQKYFLMSNLLKEDKELRHNLKLEYALKVQEYERNDKSFIRFCLMCKLCYEGSRQGYLEHLSVQHNLQLGNPQNLVFVDELINTIESKMSNLQCIYCERIFTDRHVLKEHMRKKLHKRINPENEEYDRFYIVNYLEPNKSWKTIQKEDDRYAISREVNADEEYSDWNEKEDQIICLFCKAKETDINVICQHMEAEHGFSFTDVTKDLDFFQKVKLINYIRKQIHENRCSYCQLKFETFDDLEKHLTGENHYKIPHLKTFDQPEFYFPTYENDAFLYLIDDVEDN
ncbi:zinc finger protein 277 isoform X1 [Diorhabda sublineata]|uniref:zinc finger protein 277 isoform X1 n=1 Tax=Diorhabda sublineata TaxID=1163346 RepID=UPI0024E0E9E4|nr:zinc finger protein 277 isoform X1 [Diorhabda sublineata]